MHPLNKAIIVAAMCIPLVAQSLDGGYRLIAEAKYYSPTEITSNREATNITYDSKKECEQVAKEMTKQARKLSDDMTHTEFNVLCNKDGEPDDYGSVYTPGDRKTFVLQRGELQDSIGRASEASYLEDKNPY